MKRVLVFLAAGCGLSFSAAPVDAQWSFRASPWVWFNGMNGEVRVDGGPVTTIDAGSSDFDFAPMLTFSGTSGQIGFLVDLAFTPGTAEARANGTVRIVEIDNFIGTGLVTYDVTPRGGSEAFVGAGLRVLNTNVSVPALTTPPVEAAEETETFVDPVFGLGGIFGDRVTFTAYGDLGGFGISSDFTYQLYGALGYRFTTATSAQLGYRLISHDAMDGDEFLYNVRQGGFLFGVTFSF